MSYLITLSLALLLSLSLYACNDDIDPDFEGYPLELQQDVIVDISISTWRELRAKELGVPIDALHEHIDLEQVNIECSENGLHMRLSSRLLDSDDVEHQEFHVSAANIKQASSAKRELLRKLILRELNGR